jgi:hypothetical protein
MLMAMLPYAALSQDSAAPSLFISVINQQRMALCPQMGQYDGGDFVASHPTLFSAEGVPMLAQTEVRLFGSNTRSKVYRANVVVNGDIDEASLLPLPCDDDKDLAMTFDSPTRAPLWLTKPDARRLESYNGDMNRRDLPVETTPENTTPETVTSTPEPVDTTTPKLVFKSSTASTARASTARASTARASTARASTTIPQTTSAVEVPLVFGGITLPLQYTAVDRYIGSTKCKAFNVMHQGSSQGCAVFASTAVMSARMCMSNDRESSIDNVVFSARQNGDCASPGWTTSWSVNTFGWQMSDPGQMVAEWCAPLNGTNEGPCTRGVCAEGMRYGGLPGSYMFVYGIPAMMAEILKNGPGSSRLMVMSQFMNSYSRGIFNRTFNAAEGSGHKVMLVGWGSENGVPYWTIQNSWGAWWGEGGFARILRGANVMNIEAEGLEIVKPISSAPKCADKPQCNVWSRTLADCSCSCERTFRVGNQCETCPADTCLNGGEMLDPSCYSCTCAYGYFGLRCEYGVDFKTRRWSACPSTSIDMNYTFTDVPNHPYYGPPMGKSVVNFYAPGATSTFSCTVSALVCSAALTVKCPPTGSIVINAPAVAAVYKVYMMRSVNTNGATTFYTPTGDNNLYLGEITVLSSTNAACKTAALLAATGSPRAPIITAIATGTALAAASAARLAVAQPVIDEINAKWGPIDSVPTIAITTPVEGLSDEIMEDILPADGYLWANSFNLYNACPTVPPQLNNSLAKKITLATSDGATSWNTALGATGNNAVWLTTADSGRCSSVSFSSGVSRQNNTYTVAFYNVLQNSNIALSRRFRLKAVTFVPRPWVSSGTAGFFFFRTTFTYEANAVPMLMDTIKFYDINGIVVDTFYTYCKCRTAPIAGSKPAAAGVAHAVDLKAPKITAGQPTRAPYTVRLHRANTAAIISTVAPNVAWKNLLL